MILSTDWTLVTAANIRQIRRCVYPDQARKLEPGCAVICTSGPGEPVAALAVWPDENRFAYCKGGGCHWGDWQWGRGAQILDDDETKTPVCLPSLSHADLRLLASIPAGTNDGIRRLREKKDMRGRASGNARLKRNRWVDASGQDVTESVREAAASLGLWPAPQKAIAWKWADATDDARWIFREEVLARLRSEDATVATRGVRE